MNYFSENLCVANRSVLDFLHTSDESKYAYVGLQAPGIYHILINGVQ